MSTEAETITFQPRLPPVVRPLFEQFASGVENSNERLLNLPTFLENLLAAPQVQGLPLEDWLSIRLFVEVLRDLLSQGWHFKYLNDSFIAIPPEATNGNSSDQDKVKAALRNSLIAARNEQLQEPAVRRFVLDLEKPRRHHGRQVSVLNLFLSPEELAADIQQRLEAPEANRQELLLGVISPYLQLATEARDEFTNLRLLDIWRYCRYTWSLPLSAQPGRQMMYLIRDAARDFHPIIGIGALGNSIVQITCRDEAIGWSLSTFKQDPNVISRLQALEQGLDQAIDEILWKDLASAKDIARPTSKVLKKLAEKQKDVVVSRSADLRLTSSFAKDARSTPYQRKRAMELYRLLHAKQIFQQAKEEAHEDYPGMAQRLLAREEGQQALGVSIRSIKKRHIGSSMMDITTCGALPPYSELLGGKLVALLMASPQVIADYLQRYKDTASEIASRMKGEPVIRPAKLVLLGTTSLYYIGSSQYNRLQAPGAKGTLRYQAIGKTLGFGSVHLSQRTYFILQKLLETHPDLKPHSNAFAAGVNYKLRSIATGLSHLGLEKLMQHNTPRLVYIVPLATNWREYLTGLDSEPQSIFTDLNHPEVETAKLIEFWKHRWLLPRIQRPETLYHLREQKSAVRVSNFIQHEPPAVQHTLFDMNEVDGKIF